MFALIPPPPGNVLEIGPLTVHYYGIAIAIGVVLAVLLLRRRYSALGGDPDLADRTAVWGVGIGFLGGRLAYVSTHLDRFVDRPWAILFIWEGGLAFFGGLTLGTLAVLWYLRRNGADVWTFGDAAAPGIPLAHAIGRWGNYFNEELYGTPTDLPWGLRVTHEPQPVHPTFLYESLANLVLFGLLLLASRSGRIRRGGLIFCYLAGYGAIRFLTELLRTDTTFRVFGLSRNAYVALAIVVIGLVGLRWRQRQPVPPTSEPNPTASEPIPADAEPVPADPNPGASESPGERVENPAGTADSLHRGDESG